MHQRINVKEICGTGKVTRADGARINRLLRAAWDGHDCIEVDFDNVRIASVSFLDEAIGLLAFEKDLSEIKKKLHVVNISRFDERLLDDILTSRASQRRRSGGRTKQAQGRRVGAKRGEEKRRRKVR